MTTAEASTHEADYRARIVPTLHRIQHEYGYLKREKLKEAAEHLGVPLHRLQAVASFFPHFNLTEPKPVVVSVCRDMACNFNGSQAIRDQLRSLVGDKVEVKGVSCTGRCDRPVSACITAAGQHNDHYYHKRTAAELKDITDAFLRGEVPKPDLDADLGYSGDNFLINPYHKRIPSYDAVSKVVALREASLQDADRILASKFNWSIRQIEQFHQAARARTPHHESEDDDIAKAVTAWATNSDWAAGKTLGDWSDAVMDQMKEASLRGMGGAGMAHETKLKDVRNAIRKARARHTDTRGFIVVNGDESEPGTFKDRELLLHTPHLIIEAVIIAGILTEATQGFIYIRHEYTEQIEACRAEIRRAESMGVCGKDASVLGRSFPVEVFVSPGGYICGEQSALIEAMSDRRGEPRNLPPKLETNGLENMPTIVSNVETYGWIPYVVLNGGKNYAALGTNGWKGRRFFSISGDLKRPGVYEVPMGMTLRELIYGENYCQGIIDDRKLKAFAPSGPSGGFLPAVLTKGFPIADRDRNSKVWKAIAQRRGFDPATATTFDILDLELELDLFRGLSPTSALGAGLVVYADHRDMLEQAMNSLQFYRNESCGKCVPCRVGSQKMVSLAENLVAGKIAADYWKAEIQPLMASMADAIGAASICGLGRSVPIPLDTVARFFEADLIKHLAPSQKP